MNKKYNWQDFLRRNIYPIFFLPKSFWTQHFSQPKTFESRAKKNYLDVYIKSKEFTIIWKSDILEGRQN